MTENLGAAVPSEPTTPDLDAIRERLDGYHRDLGNYNLAGRVEYPLAPVDVRALLEEVARLRANSGWSEAREHWDREKSARVEVGPSPEQIDALLQQAMDEEGSEGFLAIVTSDANGNNDWFPADDVIARFFELLVAACSVRGAE